MVEMDQSGNLRKCDMKETDVSWKLIKKVILFFLLLKMKMIEKKQQSVDRK